MIDRESLAQYITNNLIHNFRVRTSFYFAVQVIIGTDKTH